MDRTVRDFTLFIVPTGQAERSRCAPSAFRLPLIVNLDGPASEQRADASLARLSGAAQNPTLGNLLSWRGPRVSKSKTAPAVPRRYPAMSQVASGDFEKLAPLVSDERLAAADADGFDGARRLTTEDSAAQSDFQLVDCCNIGCVCAELETLQSQSKPDHSLQQSRYIVAHAATTVKPYTCTHFEPGDSTLPANLSLNSGPPPTYRAHLATASLCGKLVGYLVQLHLY
jgi:hypothetical protein